MKHTTAALAVCLVSISAIGCGSPGPADESEVIEAQNSSDPSKDDYAPPAAGEEPSGASNADDSESVGSVSSLLVAGRYDIGVIANGTCPNPVTIYMDDEDSSNNSSRTGWVGSINSQTRFNFCRVDGSVFRGVGWCSMSDYAVLKLGSDCPVGSFEFTRNFDNEDTSNNNSSSGGIAPSTQNSGGTSLKFCAFIHYPLAKCTGGSPPVEFPNVGFSYGVFAQPLIYGALETGQIYTDDEDSGNRNSWDLSKLPSHGPGVVAELMSGSSNTTLKTVRAK